MFNLPFREKKSNSEKLRRDKSIKVSWSRVCLNNFSLKLSHLVLGSTTKMMSDDVKGTESKLDMLINDFQEMKWVEKINSFPIITKFSLLLSGCSSTRNLWRRSSCEKCWRWNFRLLTSRVMTLKWSSDRRRARLRRWFQSEARNWRLLVLCLNQQSRIVEVATSAQLTAKSHRMNATTNPAVDQAPRPSTRR